MEPNAEPSVSALTDILGKFKIQNQLLQKTGKSKQKDDIAIMRQIHWSESSMFARSNTENSIAFTMNAFKSDRGMDLFLLFSHTNIYIYSLLC